MNTKEHTNGRRGATDRYPEGTQVARYAPDGSVLFGTIGKATTFTHNQGGHKTAARWVKWENGTSRVYTIKDLDCGADGLVTA